MSKSKPDLESYYTVTEVAERFHTASRTIIRKIEAGLFPGAFKLGDDKRSEWRIPGAAVDSFIEKRRQAIKPTDANGKAAK